MARRNSEFDPTHVLVVTDDGAAEISATNAAIDAILDRARTVDIRLAEDQLADDHPDLVASIRDVFGRVDDGHYSGAVDDCRPTLSELLSQTSFHRFVSLRHLEAFRDGRKLLEYVPDHRTFEVDTSPASGLESAVRGRIEAEAAALLPAGTLAEWSADGRRYELSPPYLCVSDDTCFALAALAGVEADDERREIRLEWESGSETIIAGLVGRLGPDRPRRFRFDSADRYETVASAFESLLGDLDRSDSGPDS